METIVLFIASKEWIEFAHSPLSHNSFFQIFQQINFYGECINDDEYIDNKKAIGFSY